MITQEEASRRAIEAHEGLLRIKKQEAKIRAKRRWHQLREWRAKQQLPSVKKYGLKKYPTILYEKCPNCGNDVKSVHPPDPLIRPFRLRKKESVGRCYVPYVFIFQCLVCGQKSADYHRTLYIAEDFMKPWLARRSRAGRVKRRIEV